MPPIFGTPYIHPHGMTQSNQIVCMMIKLDERKALQSRSRFRSRVKSFVACYADARSVWGSWLLVVFSSPAFPFSHSHHPAAVRPIT